MPPAVPQAPKDMLLDSHWIKGQMNGPITDNVMIINDCKTYILARIWLGGILLNVKLNKLMDETGITRFRLAKTKCETQMPNKIIPDTFHKSQSWRKSRTRRNVAGRRVASRSEFSEWLTAICCCLILQVKEKGKMQSDLSNVVRNLR